MPQTPERRCVAVEFTPHGTGLEPVRPLPWDESVARLLRAAGVMDRPLVTDGTDAHRFDASQADAEAAIAEWKAFVAELRRG